MNAPKLQAHEYDLLARYVERSCGIVLGPGKSYLLEGRLGPLLGETGCRSFMEFYNRFACDEDPAMRNRIVDAITTNETMWFRDGIPWRILRDQILPDLLNPLAQRPPGPIRIWSAASSTGQEPYSIAMLIDDLRKRRPDIPFDPAQIEIVGSDISPSALFVARSGRYDEMAMRRGMEGEWASFRERYFVTEGRHWILRPEIRRCVRFVRHNLADPPNALGRFQLVYLRNVMIYFSVEFRTCLVDRIGRVLTPKGLLCVGATETLRDCSTRFVALPNMRWYYEYQG